MVFKHCLHIAFFIILISGFSGTVFAQKQTIPDVGLGKGNPRDIAPLPMYTYENGKRTDLEQELTFVAISFRKRPIPKEQRHEYYKKIKLVVSEVNEPALLAQNLFVVRLMPGATAKKWNIFTEYMRHDKELDWVGRVFYKTTPDGLHNLYVSGKEIAIRFKDGSSPDAVKAVKSSQPLDFVRNDSETGEAVFSIKSIKIDPIDLCNRLYESGRYESVRPLFIELKGKPVTEETREQVMQGFMKAAPEDMKKKLEDMAKEKNLPSRKDQPADRPAPAK